MSSECSLDGADPVSPSKYSISAYVKENRRLFTLWGAILLPLVILALFCVPIEYFYSRLNTDALWYYLLGEGLARTGSFHAKVASNLPNLSYVGWPGYLRFPLFYLARDFDTCLRAIQIGNVLLAFLLSIFYAFHINRLLPGSMSRILIPGSILLLTLTNFWPINIILPLGDVLFTLATLIAIQLLEPRLLASSHGWQHRARWAAAWVTILLAVMLKFTGIFLLLFVLRACLRNGEKHVRTSRVLLFALLSAVVAFCVFFASRHILQAYSTIWIFKFMACRSQVGSFWIFNFLAVHLPSQIIPHLGYCFPGNGSLPVHFGTLPHPLQAAVCSLVGLAVSLTIFLGLWKGRTTYRTEMLYVLLGIPIYLPIASSTTRYMAYSQVFIWLFFLLGLGSLARIPGLGSREWTLQPGRLVLPVLALSALVLGFRFKGTAFNNRISSRNYFASIRETAEVYGSLNRFLAAPALADARILCLDTGQARWGAIRGLPNLAPDAGLARAVQSGRVYLVLDTIRKVSPDFGRFVKERTRALDAYGPFRLREVFHSENRAAMAQVFLLEGAAPGGGECQAQSLSNAGSRP